MVRWWHVAALLPMAFPGGPGLAADDAATRGAYVALAADCQTCHTVPGGQPFAGGVALATPFGTIYSVNITPDPETGIGGWSEADFARALREGRGRHGEYLYPAMPYDYYTRITDADVTDLWAFLQTVTPSRQENRANGLGFPFDIRTGLAAWQALFLHPARFQPDSERDAAYNRGAYLVEALGHCGACHTPRNVLGAVEPGRALTGASIDQWYAPDIATDPLSGIAEWSVEEVAQFLRTGTNSRNVAAVGPMGEVVHHSLTRLTEPDLQAMAVYLKTAPPPAEPPAAPPAAPLSAAAASAGTGVYAENCATCHKDDGAGVTAIAPALADNSAVTARLPDNVLMAVLQGLPARGTWSAMPAFATVLTDREIADVANHVRTSWGNRGEPDVTPWLVGAKRMAIGAAAAGSAATPVFFCPKLQRYRLDPDIVVELGNLERPDLDRAALAGLIGRYRSANPGASTADMMGAFLTGYCPVIESRDQPYQEKGEELANFMGQVASIAAQPR